MDFLKSLGSVFVSPLKKVHSKDLEDVVGSENWMPLLEEAMNDFYLMFRKQECSEAIFFMKDRLGSVIEGNFLHFCIENGNNRLLEKFLELCDDSKDILEVVDEYNQTPLHVAITMGNHKAVCLLCEKCNDELIEIRNKNNENVVELAARKGIIEIFFTVYNKFYNCNILDSFNKYFRGMVIAVIRKFFKAVKLNDRETVLKMLDADPTLKTKRNEDGRNALHVSTYYGHTEMMKLLLEYKTDYDYHYRQLGTAKNGNTALHIAVKRDFVECAQILLDGGRERLLFFQNKNFKSVKNLIDDIKRKNNESEMVKMITEWVMEVNGKEQQVSGQYLWRLWGDICHLKSLSNNLGDYFRHCPYLLERGFNLTNELKVSDKVNYKYMIGKMYR